MNEKDCQELESLRNAACCIPKRAYTTPTYRQKYNWDESKHDLRRKKFT